MCDSCGCDGTEVVEVGESLLAGNDREAAHNREHLRRRGVLAINLMGSPGSGKTALLEATARAAGGRLRIAAVNGDLATDLDAERLERAGIPCLPITTGTACHLDAKMIHRALHALDLEGVDVLFFENVGNLVCPSLFDLGQAANVVALSVTEGEDKPLKYPPMFARADLVVLTKVDLLPYLPVSLARFEEHVGRVCPGPAPLPVSVLSGEGIAAWMAWLEARRWEAGAQRHGQGASRDPHGDDYGHDHPHGHGHDHGHGHGHGHGHDHGHLHHHPHDSLHDPAHLHERELGGHGHPHPERQRAGAAPGPGPGAGAGEAPDEVEILVGAAGTLR